MITNTDSLLRELIALDRENLQLERNERRWGAVRMLLIAAGLVVLILL